MTEYDVHEELRRVATKNARLRDEIKLQGLAVANSREREVARERGTMPLCGQGECTTRAIVMIVGTTRKRSLLYFCSGHADRHWSHRLKERGVTPL